MLRRVASVAASAVLVGGIAAAAAPAASASPLADARAINKGLTAAVESGKLKPSEAAAHRLSVRRARIAIGKLPAERATPLARVLHLVRLQAPAYRRPRALALFGMLDENRRYLVRRALPRNGTDVVGSDGIVYRAGWGYGLQFHPLANLGALNQAVNAGARTRALALAGALRDRLVPRPNGSVLEYYFPFGGGRPPWTSGMVQSVAAQAFARTAQAFDAPELMTPARRSFLALRGGLVQQVSSVPWIRHYSFSSLVVLNSHLQSTFSLMIYGRISGLEAATSLANRFEASGRALLGRFDTGAWTTYQPGAAHEATLEYHLYHVDLTGRLARQTRDEFWQDAHVRFDGYSHEPPALRMGPAVPKFYPWPQDGFRDAVPVRFWLSKISKANVRVGGVTYGLGVKRRGWHAFLWRPGRKTPREYRPRLTATDLAGNRGTTLLREITVAVDTTPPEVEARVRGKRLRWTVTDPTSPWVRLRLKLVRNGVVRVQELGVRPKTGALDLGLPRGRWNATLAVFDSSGNRTRVQLGPVPNGP